MKSDTDGWERGERRRVRGLLLTAAHAQLSGGTTLVFLPVVTASRGSFSCLTHTADGAFVQRGLKSPAALRRNRPA